MTGLYSQQDKMGIISSSLKVWSINAFWDCSGSERVGTHGSGCDWHARLIYRTDSRELY